MQNPLAIALSESPTPEQMYARTFVYFQSIFSSHPKADVSRSNIFSHALPEASEKNKRKSARRIHHLAVFFFGRGKVVLHAGFSS